MGVREDKKRKTRELILSVAEQFFNRVDFDQVTIDDIAAAASISRKTFFNYFPSKAQLLEELISDWMASSSLWASENQLADDAESALIPPDIDKITDWVVQHRRLLKMVDKHTQLFHSSFDGSGQYQAKIHAKSRQPRLLRVAQAQAAGLIRDDVEAKLICQMYDALRLDAVRYWLHKPDNDASAADFHRYYHSLKAILLKGISP